MGPIPGPQTTLISYSKIKVSHSAHNTRRKMKAMNINKSYAALLRYTVNVESN